jgi:hypothetical protein
MKIIDIILRLTCPKLKKKMSKRAHLENNLDMLRTYNQKRIKPTFKTEIVYSEPLSKQEELEILTKKLEKMQRQILNKEKS